MGFVNLLVNSFVFESVELLLRLNLIYVTDFHDIRIFFFFFQFLVCGVFIDFVVIIIIVFLEDCSCFEVA